MELIVEFSGMRFKRSLNFQFQNFCISFRSQLHFPSVTTRHHMAHKKLRIDKSKLYKWLCHDSESQNLPPIQLPSLIRCLTSRKIKSSLLKVTPWVTLKITVKLKARTYWLLCFTQLSLNESGDSNFMSINWK